uniref:Uncharacterized protein n=1 Tax=Neogobius melanostomus TaxID=47308 RepID=A0A8C6UFK4_9GOBI
SYVSVLLGTPPPPGDHLEKHLPEMSGGDVVEERVDDGAEVEEGVGDGVQRDVVVEVRHGPARFGHRGHHEATDLVGEPAHHQRANDQTWKERKSHG